jgi:cytidylate kinase/pantoate ligase/cytidylate kinase
MIVTIDGPAGAGKSSAAKALARRLGFRFLDTGAMYRAVALAGIERSVDWNDPGAIEALAARLSIEVLDDRVFLDGTDVTERIRSSDVTSAVHYVADHPAVRGRLADLQRQAARGGGIVTEGRDQGTVVFPDADCKIFLTAAPEERARRRMRDLREQGEDVSFQEVLAQQNERDRRDCLREAGGLVAARDAAIVPTDGLTPEQVVDKLESLVRAGRKP